MEYNTRHPVRIAIVGTGHVGATFAYALLLRGIASEIVLINLDHGRAEGEAMDLNHGMLYTRPARVWAGDFTDCASADIVVLAAGVGQRPGETRLDLLRRNAEVFKEIVPRIVQINREAILIVVTNPVDVLTHVTWMISDLPVSQVIGSGTILDTARFRYLLSQHFEVEPRSVHAFIIGEHGDSQVPVWSLANIAGIRLDDYSQLNGHKLGSTEKAEIALNTRSAAYEIIRRKGATYYAIATGLVRIIEAIVRDENSVLTVSRPVEDIYELKDVSLSLPSVVNRRGAVQTLELPLVEEEYGALVRSANIIHEAIGSVGS
jgi:L-lactate dehydrogenase